MKKLYLFKLFFLFFVGNVLAQNQQDYSNNATLAQRVKSLAAKYPQLVKSKILTQTTGGKEPTLFLRYLEQLLAPTNLVY